MLVSHRDAALAGFGRVPTTPRALVAAEAVVGVMRAGGLSDRVIALGVDQLILYVAASAFEQSLYEYGEMSSEEVEQYFEDVHDFYSSLPARAFPVLASIADDIVGFDGEERLQFGLEALDRWAGGPQRPRAGGPRSATTAAPAPPRGRRTPAR